MVPPGRGAFAARPTEGAGERYVGKVKRHPPTMPIPVGWLMMTKPSRSDLLSLLDILFEHVLPIHGMPVLGDARQRYRPAIEKFAEKAPNA
jgi:hypothetical protein